MTRATPHTAPDAVTFRNPQISDGVRLWEIARDTQILDLNSGYAYTLWCRDFHATSIVAEIDERPVGYVTGYVLPAAPSTLFVWQVAVDASCRGQGLAGRMLDILFNNVKHQGIRTIETTITPDNEASQAMFAGLAARHRVPITSRELFTPDQLAGCLLPEDLYTIGPATSPVGDPEGDN